ncbi:MAG TPA: hypothetical protein DHV62_00135 [Elusimicrobia bacterium]|nr:hypothetical protein [Elusimicrobiota bacterium]
MTKNTFYLNQKSTIIILRWVIILVLFFFLNYTKQVEIIFFWKKFFFIFFFYVFSNIIFIFLPLRLFFQRSFNYFVFLLDTVLITLGIYFTQGFNTDIYLAYFLVIFMSTLRQDVRGSIFVGIISAFLYFALLLKGGEKINFLDSGILLRIPFLFIVALFSSHFSEQARLEEEKIHSQMMQMERLLFLGESIGGIVHQVKHPLASISANCQTILMDEKIETIKERAKRINTEIMNCAHIIDKLLQFVRLQTTGKTQADVNTLLEDTLELRKDQFVLDNIKVVKEFKKLLPKINADSTLLQQVFLNIIRNAHQAMLSLTTKGRELTVETDYDDKNVKIKFTDTGPGIPEENLEKIFQPFFTTKNPEEGVGLGLSIAKRIIEEHKGKIYALSKINKGTTIVIELPLTETQKEVS